MSQKLQFWNQENCWDFSISWTNRHIYLFLCRPMNYIVHWIIQARILEWVAFPFSRGSSQPRDQTQVSCIAGRFFTNWAIKEAQTLDSSPVNYIPINWIKSRILLVSSNTWLRLSKRMLLIFSHSFPLQSLRTKTALKSPRRDCSRFSPLHRWQPNFKN